jgi:hypothetical protein
MDRPNLSICRTAVSRMEDQYPERLLPRPIYRKIDFESAERNALFLVRHTDDADLLSENGQLKSEHVAYQTDHLRDYSTNLLGEFHRDDVHWQWPKYSEYLREWEEGTSVPVPTYPDQVSLNKDRGVFFLRISEFHNRKFTVETPKGQLTATCQVVHTPTRGNFWHCSLRWIVNGQDVIENTQGERKRILKEARHVIINRASLNLPDYEPISPDNYSPVIS